jgi:myo-inositol-1(or 4)-monophosphatase
VSTKSTPTDVVTASDTAVETLVRDRIAHLRPGDAVVGEEHGGEVAATGVAWVVDPIDGTVNFLYGMPWYAVSLAAVRDGVSLAGAVVEPASGRVWSAALGHGATCDGRPLRASGVSDPALALLGTGFSYSPQRRTRQAAMVAGLLPRVRDIRRAGSASLDLCAVAAGWVDAYLEHGCNWWDWAAGALVASEAGAVVRVPGPTGSVPPDDGLGADAVFAAAPGIAVELAALAREHGAAGV